MITTRALDVRYRGKGPAAIESVSLDISDGITALLGANGAGKTTLMRVLSGSLRPASGEVRVAGLDPFDGRSRSKALQQVALMPQTGTAPKALTALEFVRYVCWLRGMSNALAGERAAEALAAVGLESRAHERLGKLSGGMLRRVWLAQALSAQADVLLLDEPSTGLDPRQRATMVDLIRQRAGGTVLLSSHLLEDVLALASAVIVLRAGRVVHHGPITAEMDDRWLLDLLGDEAE